MTAKFSVLFVCLGNICRSPLAEAAFRHEASLAALDVVIDSAGVGHWHIGEAPDTRAQAVARGNGIDIGRYRARQVRQEDFRRFSHIVALDLDNLSILKQIAPPDGKAELSLLLDHVEGREGQAVADPYYGGDDGFHVAWMEVTLGAQGLVRRLAALQ